MRHDACDNYRCRDGKVPADGGERLHTCRDCYYLSALDEKDARIAELEAKNEMLKDRVAVALEIGAGEAEKLRERIAELEAALDAAIEAVRGE